MRELRADAASLLSKPQVQGDGTVIYDAVLSRVGVLQYKNPDGSTRNEYRPPEEVFNPDSMQSFFGMAAIDNHMGNEPVTLANRSAVAKGYIVANSLRRDGDYLIGKVHVTDAAMVASIAAGKTAVSLGYFQDRVAERGTSREDGQSYQYKQTNIRGNHVAFVDVARAGDMARVRVDGITAIEHITGDTAMDPKELLEKITKLTVDCANMQAQITALTAEKTALQKANDKLTADCETATDKATKADKLRIDGETDAMARAEAKVELRNKAIVVLTVDGVAPDLNKMSERQIKEAVIVKMTGKPIPAGKADAYIDARFDGVIEDHAEAQTNDAQNARTIAAVLPTVRNSGGAGKQAFNADGTPNFDGMTADEARAYSAKRDNSAWNAKK